MKAIVLLTSFSLAVAAHAGTVVQPLFDEPVRDTSVCRGPDGIYYLTGTSGPDFDNNAGIRLWKSADLKKWEPVGLVWDLAKDVTSHKNIFEGQFLRQYRTVLDGSGRADKVRGVSAPEIHYLRDTFWIAFSMNRQGTGLLKSTSGKAEGPYKFHAQITLSGGDPSLFADDDGKVYWLFDGGWIARMNDDLTGLDERPRLLQPASDGGLPDFPLQVGKRGAFLFKAEGRYYLTAADYNGRVGAACNDTFIAWATDVYGPYSERQLMLPHGGGVTVFRDEAGKYYSTFYGDDPRSIFRDRPAIVPLEWTTDVMYAKPSGRILVRPRHVIVERGPWAAVKPLFDVNIRDVHAMCSPDGTYYYTGSVLDRPGELVVWKSADMKTWEEMKPLWTMENVYSDPKWPADSAAKPFASLSKVERGRAETFWGTEIHFFKNTFWIEFRFSGHNGKASGTGLLRSTTGKAEGPYESLGRITKTGPCSLFVDDDGSVYLIAGFGGLLKLKPDMSGVVSEDESRSLRLNEFPDGGVAGDDTGSRMVKIAGKYVLLTIDWGGTSTMHLSKPAGGRHYGTYDVDYSVADNITGPYSRPRIAIPHGGHGNIFRDKAGNWWASFFSNDSTSPLRTQPGLIPLRIPTEGGTLVIQPGD